MAIVEEPPLSNSGVDGVGVVGDVAEVGEGEASLAGLSGVDGHYWLIVDDAGVEFCDIGFGGIHGGGDVAAEHHVVCILPGIIAFGNHKVVEGAGVGVVGGRVGSELGETNSVGDVY